MAGDNDKIVQMLFDIGIKDKAQVTQVLNAINQTKAALKAANDEANRESRERIALIRAQVALEVQASRERIALAQAESKERIAALNAAARASRDEAQKEIKDAKDVAAARRQTDKEIDEAQRKREAAQRTTSLGAARGFVSLGFGSWAIPGLAQDQNQLIDNILLGAAAIEQFGAQMGGILKAAREANMSFLGLAAGMLPVLAAATAITIGFKMLQDRLEEVAKAEKDLIKVREQAAQVASANVGKERNMTFSQLRTQESDLGKQIGFYGNARSANVERIMSLQAQIKGIDDKGILMGGENFVKRQELQRQLDEEKKALDALNPKYQELVLQQQYNTQVLEPLVKSWEEFNKAIERHAMFVQMDVRENQLVNGGSTDDVRSEIAKNQEEIFKAEKELSYARTKLAETDDENQKRILQDAIDKSEERVDVLKEENNILLYNIMPVVQARELEKLAAERSAKAFEEHVKAVESNMKAMDEAVKKRQQYEQQIEDERVSYGKKIEQQTQEDFIKEVRTGIERRYQKRIEDTREQERQAENAKKRQKIIDDAARAEIKADQDLQQKFKDIDAKYKNRQDDINRNYMEKSLDDLDKFHKAAKAKEDDYYKKRARLIEDAQDKLIQLAADRDVLGFIMEQRELQKKLRRLDEDHQIEADQDAQAYADRLKAAQDARDKELEAAKADYELQRQQAQEHYNLDKAQRQEALDERLRQEDENNKIRISKADAIEKELQGLRDKWQREDEARRRKIEEDGYNERMKRLQKFVNDANAELDRLRPSVNAYNNPETLVSEKRNRFATGIDYVPHDYFPMFADAGEAVLNKYEAAEWRMGRANKGQSINLTINYSTSELASKQDLYEHGGELMQIVSNTFERL